MRLRPVLLVGAAVLVLGVAVLAVLATRDGEDRAARASPPGATTEPEVAPAAQAPADQAPADQAPADQAPASPARATYALSPSRRCLERSGAEVAPLGRDDDRRAALADLAQRTSIEARFGDRWVAFGFARNARDAELVAELLVVPDDPYVIHVERNVVGMYPPRSRALAERALSCLR